MSERFYTPRLPAAATLTLSGSEAHHLLHVMRAQPGQQITLFDGQGSQATATVKQCQRQAVVVEVGRVEHVDRELAARLVLAVALPKGDRQKWLVEKLTELGVAQLVPLITQHSGPPLGDKAIDRLRRVVIEASKQCGRNKLMELAQPVELATWIAAAAAGSTRWLAHPTGEPITASASAPDAAEVRITIGPEGGFTDEEVAAARTAGWQVVALSPTILRIETAAIAMAAQWAVGSRQ